MSFNPKEFVAFEAPNGKFGFSIINFNTDPELVYEVTIKFNGDKSPDIHLWKTNEVLGKFGRPVANRNIVGSIYQLSMFMLYKSYSRRRKDTKSDAFYANARSLSEAICEALEKMS